MSFKYPISLPIPRLLRVSTINAPFFPSSLNIYLVPPFRTSSIKDTAVFIQREKKDKKLASFIHSFPAIWNRKSKNFKNKAKNEGAFRELARVLNRDQKYRKEKIKLQNARRSGDGATDVEPWCLMDTLSFFDGVMTIRRTVNSWSAEPSNFGEVASHSLENPEPREDEEKHSKIHIMNRLAHAAETNAAIQAPLPPHEEDKFTNFGKFMTESDSQRAMLDIHKVLLEYC